jgi:transcriptional regulator with XRE-family HTH domain
MKINSYEDIQTLSKERAERLKRLRNLSNMSRKQLCDESNININTYIGYEVGRYGGLTQKGANILIPYFSKKGVYTTSEWLMYGIGQSPNVITDVNEKLIEKPQILHEILNQEENNIVEELYVFQKHYKHSVDFRINDDGMSPTFDPKDFVAGIRYTGDLLNHLIGLICIVQLKEEMILVRSIQKGRTNGLYTLTCSNPNTSVTQPIIYDTKINFAAPIIWHRKIHKALIQETDISEESND